MKQRPAGAVVLAVLAVVGALSSLWAAVSGGLGAWAFGVQPTGPLVYAGINLILAVLYVAFACAAWELRSWAWTVGMISTAVAVLTSLARIAAGGAVALIELLLAATILWLLTRPRTMRAFGRM